MRVLMLSKALVVGAYQRKLEVLASVSDLELTCVVPPAWAGQSLERAHERGYRLVVRPIRLDGNFHLFHFTGLARLLHEIKPDIVHVDEEPYNLATWLATRQARAAGARVVFFTWQKLLRRYPPPFRWLERDVFARAGFALAGSNEAARELGRKGFRGPLAVIPQFGVDPAIFTPHARQAGGGQTFTIGYAGRLVEEKGVFVLLEAAARSGGRLATATFWPRSAPERAACGSTSPRRG